MPDDDDEHGCDLSRETARAAKRVREKGFVSREGRKHGPWDRRKLEAGHHEPPIEVEIVPLTELPPFVKELVDSLNSDAER